MTDALVDRLLADVPELARQVAADLGPDVDPSVVEPAVRRYLEAVAGGARLSAGELVRLRSDGAAAARAGVPLAAPLDTYLSTGWVAWEHAVGIARPDERDALAALGSALLRGGDDLAAALADGYTAAERALAARAGATRRAVLGELLAPSSGGAAQARLLRRATLVGLDPAQPYGLIVARATVELEEEGAAADEVARRLARDPARRAHLVSVRDGDLVVLLAGPWRAGAATAEAALEGFEADPGGRWWAASAEPDALAVLPRAYAAALDALRVLPACRAPGTVTSAVDVTLERALVADPALAAAGVARWLGPLEEGGRGASALVPTLEAWLAAEQSVTGTARDLGIAPRTVTYRLERIAMLLGLRDLDGAARARLATALLARRLLDAWPAAGRPA
ncbi:MAG: helix-turn-helix domain-containing protein [Chloroflexota bacterium]